MDRDDILSLDLAALDASTASGLDRSHSAPTFLESRYVLLQHSCSALSAAHKRESHCLHMHAEAHIASASAKMICCFESHLWLRWHAAAYNTCSM